MLVIKWLMAPINFHSIFSHTVEVNGVWFFKIVQNILFCVQHKKEMYTGLDRHEGEVFIFGWTVSLDNFFYIYDFFE